MNYFFVYGTLKRGEQNHHLIEHAEFVDVGYVRGCVLFDLGGCPAMMPGGSRQVDEVNHAAKGEIFAVEDEHLAQTLANLDALEQEGSLYIRAKLTVHSQMGSVCECITYLFIPSLHDERVVLGGWWSGRDAYDQTKVAGARTPSQ